MYGNSAKKKDKGEWDGECGVFEGTYSDQESLREGDLGGQLSNVCKQAVQQFGKEHSSRGSREKKLKQDHAGVSKDSGK